LLQARRLSRSLESGRRLRARPALSCQAPESPHNSKSAMAAQLRTVCRQQIMEEVMWAINPHHKPAAGGDERPAAAEAPQGAAAYKVLVLDGFATRIISSCCKMSDITDAGVSHVENLAVRRQPLPMLEAIYFVAPTKASVAAICRDYQGRRKAQYAKAHIVFTGHLPDDLLHQISQNRNLCGRIAALKELNMEFLAVEDAIFSLEMKNVFHDLHADPAPASKAATQAKMAQRLASLCITLGSEQGELPLIRYDQASEAATDVASALGVHSALPRTAPLSAPTAWSYLLAAHALRAPAGSLACSRLTGRFCVCISERELRRFRDADRDGSARVLQTNARRHATGSRATVLVLDRAQDIASSLVHELTYQAMCQDLLDVSDTGVVQREFRAAGGAAQQKADVLTDEDSIWAKYKHKHIGDIMGELPTEFKEFQESSGVANFQNIRQAGGSADFKDMTKVVKELPRYTKKQDKFSMHISLTQKVFKVYQERGLEDICKLEMDMLFGEDSTGSNVLGGGMLGGVGTLRATAVQVLREASETDRARLLAMLQVTQPQLAAELLESGELVPYPAAHSAAEGTVKRLATVPEAGRYATRSWKTDRDDFPGYTRGDKLMDQTSRYKPALYWTANDIIDPAKSLDSRAFPYCGEDPGPAAPAFTQATVRTYRTDPLLACVPACLLACYVRCGDLLFACVPASLAEPG
jgi:hypothetical protein